MSNKRYTEEFKQEAVRQVVDRGYSTAEVARRLGVTAHSLYAWKKKYGPDSAEHLEQKRCLLPNGLSVIFSPASRLMLSISRMRCRSIDRYGGQMRLSRAIIVDSPAIAELSRWR